MTAPLENTNRGTYEQMGMKRYSDDEIKVKSGKITLSERPDE